MNPYDWKIHKKLMDAGGVGERIYIYTGRGNGKTFRQQEVIDELIAAGKEVYAVRRDHTPEPDLSIDKIKEAIVDYDIYPIRERWRSDDYGLDHFVSKDYKPRIRIGTSIIYDDSFFSHALRHWTTSISIMDEMESEFDIKGE